MPTQLLLRSALAANAGFSAAVGLVLSIAPSAINDVIGIELVGLTRAFGIALLIHAVMLGIAVRDRDVRRWATLNLAAIAPYPFAMMAVAATVASGASGRTLVLADGAAIGVLAVALLVGLRSSAPAT